MHDAAEEPEAMDCPTCGTPNDQSGMLGRRLHFTCRACGMWYSKETPEDLSTPAKVARLIKRDWTKVHYAAVPYLESMLSLNSIEDNDWHDSGKSVVLYFLNNARTYRGDNAVRYKAALKAMCGLK